MNKFVLSIMVIAVVVIALGTAGFVYAQTPTPQAPATGYGSMMGGRGGHGRMATDANGMQDGLLHDEMITAFAENLGISVEDLNARLENGETMAQIASSEGLTVDQFSTLMTEARAQAIDQAVQNGTLAQEQADWMKQRGAGMGSRQGRGNRGATTNPNCPYFQTNP